MSKAKYTPAEAAVFHHVTDYRHPVFVHYMYHENGEEGFSDYYYQPDTIFGWGAVEPRGKPTEQGEILLTDVIEKVNSGQMALYKWHPLIDTPGEPVQGIKLARGSRYR